MTAAKSPKKNETIEIRLSDEAKTAFMARCRREGRTASEVIRTFVDEPPAPHARPRRTPYGRMAIAALVGAMVGAGVAAPSLARSVNPTRPAFDQLDRDHDGVLTYAEYQSH